MKGTTTTTPPKNVLSASLPRSLFRGLPACLSFAAATYLALIRPSLPFPSPQSPSTSRVPILRVRTYFSLMVAEYAESQRETTTRHDVEDHITVFTVRVRLLLSRVARGDREGSRFPFYLLFLPLFLSFFLSSVCLSCEWAE